MVEALHHRVAQVVDGQIFVHVDELETFAVRHDGQPCGPGWREVWGGARFCPKPGSSSRGGAGVGAVGNRVLQVGRAACSAGRVPAAGRALEGQAPPIVIIGHMAAGLAPERPGGDRSSGEHQKVAIHLPAPAGIIRRRDPDAGEALPAKSLGDDQPGTDIDDLGDLKTSLGQGPGQRLARVTRDVDHRPPARPHAVTMDQPPRRLRQHDAGQVVVAEDGGLIQPAAGKHHLPGAQLDQAALVDGQPTVRIGADTARAGDHLDRPSGSVCVSVWGRGVHFSDPRGRRRCGDQGHLCAGLCGRLCGSAPGRAGADHSNIRKGIAFGRRIGLPVNISVNISVNMPVRRDHTQPGAAADQPFPKRPQAGGSIKGPIVEAHRQKAPPARGARPSVVVERAFIVLRPHDHAVICGGGFRRHVGRAVDRDQQIAVAAVQAQHAPGAVIFERPADHAHPACHQGAGDGVSRKGADGPSLEGEAERPFAVDGGSVGGRQAAHGPPLPNSFSAG